jgi:hypothetical protein
LRSAALRCIALSLCFWLSSLPLPAQVTITARRTTASRCSLAARFPFPSLPLEALAERSTEMAHPGHSWLALPLALALPFILLCNGGRLSVASVVSFCTASQLVRTGKRGRLVARERGESRCPLAESPATIPSWSSITQIPDRNMGRINLYSSDLPVRRLGSYITVIL